MNGYLAAAVAVAIWASYPVATRAAVTGAFSPEELVMLRFGIAALLFSPYLLWKGRAVARATWMRGLPLTLFHGAGMAGLAIAGMQLAPANHAAALGPGMSPAWVAILGLVVFAQRPSRRALLGAGFCVAGVATLAYSGTADPTLSVLAGDAMFLGASALAALYVLQLRRWGIGAVQGAAIVSLYSALIAVPYYLGSVTSPLSRIAPTELAWQVLWQGVLIGCIAVIALNQAISRLGAERCSALVAFVPVLTAILGLVFLRELPSTYEMAALIAISAGVSIGAARAPVAFMPAAPLLAAQPQNAPRVAYPARDNAP